LLRQIRLQLLVRGHLLMSVEPLSRGLIGHMSLKRQQFIRHLH